VPVKVGAQDISAETSGAFTGEVSGTQLAKLNVSYVTVGHSERREYHGESDALVGAKAKGLRPRIVPIVCIGEGLDCVRQQAGEYTLASSTAPLRAACGPCGEDRRRLRTRVGHWHRRGRDSRGRARGMRRDSLSPRELYGPR